MAALSTDKIKSLFQQNLTVKLLCLALAIAVWGFTIVTRESRHELIIPIELLKIPSGYVPKMKQQNEVSFILYGSTPRIRTAKKNNTTMALSLQGATVPGKTTFSNMDKNLDLPEGVRVTRTSPATIEIELIEISHIQPQGEQHK